MVDMPLCLSLFTPCLHQSACVCVRVCVILPVMSRESAVCVDCVFRELLTQYTPQTPWQRGLFIPLHITMETPMFIKFQLLFEDIKTK